MGCNEYKVEFLDSYRGLCNNLKELEEQKKTLLLTMENIKSIQISDMPSGHIKRDLSDTFVKLEEIYERITNKRAECILKKAMILSIVSKLDNSNNYAAIIRKKYIECKSWSEVANDIGLSVKQTTRLHGKALNEISDSDIPDEYKLDYITSK